MYIYIYVYVYIQYIYICIYIYAHVCVCICMHVGRVSWCKNASTLPQHSRFFFLRPVIWQFQQDGKSLKQLSLPTRSSWLPTNSSCSWKLTSCCIYQSEDTWVCPPTHGEDPKNGKFDAESKDASESRVYPNTWSLNAKKIWSYNINQYKSI